MKILTAQQIRDVDRYTIENEPVASIDLMERAANSFVQWFTSEFTTEESIAIVCGTGNNGGDGLAVGRILISKGYRVKIIVVNPNENASKDFKANEERIKGETEIRYIKSASDEIHFDEFDVVIDGLFGSGLSRPIEKGIYSNVIENINNTNTLVIAIDIPSGLFADKETLNGVIVEADYTVTFQVPKLAFLFAESSKFVGELVLVDIGLDEEYINSLESDKILLEWEYIHSLYKERRKFSHKGDYGKCLLISGSFGKMGAAVLAAKAALRTGVGLLTVHAPRCGYPVLQTAIPEAMVSPDEDEKHFSAIPEVENYDALGIGPGIGTDELTLNAFASLLSEWKKPMVIDADGINLLAHNHHLLDMVPKNSILTPHPKEFERIAGESNNSFERLELLKNYAVQHQFYVLLKGYHSAIATPTGKIYFNTTGNPGMATGGTGDVLTGMISSFLAQKYTPEEALILGVYLHGLAGDLAADDIGMDSLIASDLIEYIPDAFHSIKHL